MKRPSERLQSGMSRLVLGPRGLRPAHLTDSAFVREFTPPYRGQIAARYSVFLHGRCQRCQLELAKGRRRSSCERGARREDGSPCQVARRAHVLAFGIVRASGREADRFHSQGKGLTRMSERGERAIWEESPPID